MGSATCSSPAHGSWVVLVIYAAIYSQPDPAFHLPDWWTWVLLFFADSLAYYCFHTAATTASGSSGRYMWFHHSSEHYNFSTALRQVGRPFSSIFFSDAFGPAFSRRGWMIYLAFSWSLLYQFLLPPGDRPAARFPIEFIFNTPSHHTGSTTAPGEQYPRQELRRNLIVGPACSAASNRRKNGFATA